MQMFFEGAFAMALQTNDEELAAKNAYNLTVSIYQKQPLYRGEAMTQFKQWYSDIWNATTK